MPPANPHPHISFARRHSSASLTTLDAFTALLRAQLLVEDIKELGHFIAAAQRAGASKGRQWYWFEVISYYPVGLVTCLEWHVRSRLIDLFSFKPECITTDDLKGQITDKVLCQMVGEGLTIPQLLGAMTTVASSQKYVFCFERIFKELQIRASPRAVINTLILPSSTPGTDALQYIFDYRNRLVHEIDFSQVGPWVVRDNLDVDGAMRCARLVVDVIRAIENAITAHGPPDFPNRLDCNGEPIDQQSELEKKGLSFEDAITNALAGFRTGDPLFETDVNNWREALSLSRQAAIAERRFIEGAQFINTRHHDFKQPIVLALMRLRLEYLKILRGEL